MQATHHFQLQKDDLETVRTSVQVLTRHADEKRALKISIPDSQKDETLTLPAEAVSLLIDILEAMAAGQAVTIIPEEVELTTTQAANLLNISRPYLIQLLEAGEIPYHKVGTHRRIRIEDILCYKVEIRRKRSAVLDELVADAQELGMGYE